MPSLWIDKVIHHTWNCNPSSVHLFSSFMNCHTWNCNQTHNNDIENNLWGIILKLILIILQIIYRELVNTYPVGIYNESLIHHIMYLLHIEIYFMYVQVIYKIIVVYVQN